MPMVPFLHWRHYPLMWLWKRETCTSWVSNRMKNLELKSCLTSIFFFQIRQWQNHPKSGESSENQSNVLFLHLSKNTAHQDFQEASNRETIKLIYYCSVLCSATIYSGDNHLNSSSNWLRLRTYEEFGVIPISVSVASSRSRWDWFTLFCWKQSPVPKTSGDSILLRPR